MMTGRSRKRGRPAKETTVEIRFKQSVFEMWRNKKQASVDTGITAYLLSICCTAALEIQSVHDYNHSTLAGRLLDASTIPDHIAHRHSPSVHFWQNQDFLFPWFSRTINNSSFVSAESSRTKFCKQKCKVLIRSSLCSSCAMP